ncbi:MAG: DUF2891 domain-containing protein [Bacteroidetes bacterium]|nr:DUF2891 domain-containing protein [Bacteroidota bacterium]
MKSLKIISIVSLFFLSPGIVLGQQFTNPFLQAQEDGTLVLTQKGASFFARMALDCMQREYPNKLNQVLPDSSMLKEPRALHPAFYGCFDWHSSVHGHWMLTRLLKQFPNLPEAEEIRRKLGENLTKENLEGELAYFRQSSKSWERMYGWAWLLKLGQELQSWEDAEGQQWYANMLPLIEAIRERYLNFLPVQSIPVRTGVHPNTAFGMSFAWDYAEATADEEFMSAIRRRAMVYYGEDTNCPASWEPSGEDFLSPCLEEANLMAKVLPAAAFEAWFDRFIKSDELESVLHPVAVSDRSDPKIVHLDGLSLSRAWCLYGLRLKVKDAALSDRLVKAAAEHLNYTLPNIATEHYEGSHWLASFAVYALSVNKK